MLLCVWQLARSSWTPAVLMHSVTILWWRCFVNKLLSSVTLLVVLIEKWLTAVSCMQTTQVQGPFCTRHAESVQLHSSRLYPCPCSCQYAIAGGQLEFILNAPVCWSMLHGWGAASFPVYWQPWMHYFEWVYLVSLGTEVTYFLRDDLSLYVS